MQWKKQKLFLFRSEVGIDSFKFDAGESNWLPSSYILNSTEDPNTWPGVFSTRYGILMLLLSRSLNNFFKNFLWAQAGPLNPLPEVFTIPVCGRAAGFEPKLVKLAALPCYQ
jgi:hypothetical protein